MVDQLFKIFLEVDDKKDKLPTLQHWFYFDQFSSKLIKWEALQASYKASVLENIEQRIAVNRSYIDKISAMGIDSSQPLFEVSQFDKSAYFKKTNNYPTVSLLPQSKTKSGSPENSNGSLGKYSSGEEEELVSFFKMPANKA